MMEIVLAGRLEKGGRRLSYSFAIKPVRGKMDYVSENDCIKQCKQCKHIISLIDIDDD